MAAYTWQQINAKFDELRGMALSTPSSAFPHAINVSRPIVTHAPWLGVPAFCKVDHAIRSHTRVDTYRCFELWSLLKQTARLPGDVIEIGVWRGGSTCILAASLMDANIAKTIWACDTYAGVAKAGDRDTHYKGGEYADTSEEIVNALIRQQGFGGVETVEGIFPDETGHRFSESRFCFAHIDVDVYLSARDAFWFLWKRMPPGGVVVFDDYGFRGCEGVTRCVDELRSQLPDGVVIYNLNGQAIVLRTTADGSTMPGYASTPGVHGT